MSDPLPHAEQNQAEATEVNRARELYERHCRLAAAMHRTTAEIEELVSNAAASVKKDNGDG